MVFRRAAPDDIWLDCPGTWQRAGGDGVRTAIVSCPKCGGSVSLSRHEIAQDGSVSPSLVCPYDCDFHEFVKLEGWR